MNNYLTYTEPLPIGRDMVRQVFSVVPMRYLEGEKYRPVDPTIFSAGANSYDALRIPHKCIIPKRANGEAIYSNLGQDISIRALCRPVTGRNTKYSTVYYPDAFGEGSSLEYQVSAGQLKKNVVIERKPITMGEYLEYSFEINADGIDFENISCIKAPLAYDAAMREYHLPIIFRTINNKHYLIKRIPRWVLERCTYPLKFDAILTDIPDYFGYSYPQSSTWQIAHDATSGNQTSSNTLFIKIWGHHLEAGDYAIARGAMSVLTSGLPDNLSDAQIASAIFTCWAASCSGSPTIVLCRSFTANYNAFVAADYNDIGSDATETSGRARYTPIITYGSANAPSTSQWLNITFNANGKARINRVAGTDGGYTKIGFRENGDVINTRPASQNYSCIYVTSEAGKEPYITIDYSTTAELSNTDGGFGVSGCGHSIYRGWGQADAGSTGTSLYDLGNNFLSMGVVPGDIVINATDNLSARASAVAANTVTLLTNAGFGTGDYYIIQSPNRDAWIVQSMIPSAVWDWKGGIGLSGTVQDERTVSWLSAQDTKFLIGTQVSTIWQVTATTAAAGYPASNLKYFNKPSRIWQATGTTANNIEVWFDSGVDTIALINTNFDYYYLTVVGVQSGVQVCFNDSNKSSYTGLSLINLTGNGGKQVSHVIINIGAGQTPKFSETAYRIGSIVGFKRIALTMQPTFPTSKKLIENIKVRSFDGGTTEVERIGAPFFLMTYSFPMVSESNFGALQDLEMKSDSGGYIFVSEDYGVSGYRFRRLCQKYGNFKYDYTGPSLYSTALTLREVV